MIGHGDMTRTQSDVVNLIREKYSLLSPISQWTVNKFGKQIRELCYVKCLYALSIKRNMQFQ